MPEPARDLGRRVTHLLYIRASLPSSLAGRELLASQSTSQPNRAVHIDRPELLFSMSKVSIEFAKSFYIAFD